MRKQEAINQLESLKMIGKDERAHCYNEAIKAGILVIKKLDEQQKPVVPGFVSELLDYYRQSPDVDLLALLITFKDWYYSTAKDGDHEEAIDWLVKHPEIYMRAWLFGYEVEKETLYEVIIGDLYLIKKFNNRNDFYFDTNCSLCAWEKSAYQLTEAEIKAIDERFWPFAVPVEEVEEG